MSRWTRQLPGQFRLVVAIIMNLSPTHIVMVMLVVMVVMMVVMMVVVVVVVVVVMALMVVMVVMIVGIPSSSVICAARVGIIVSCVACIVHLGIACIIHLGVACIVCLVTTHKGEPAISAMLHKDTHLQAMELCNCSGAHVFTRQP